jgi:hypothetical protein
MVKFVLRALGVLVTLVLGTLVLAQAATAATTDAASAAPTTLQILLTINLVVSVVAPLFVSFVTNSNADPRVKTVVNLLVSAIVGTITPFLTGQVSIDDFNLWVVLLSIAQVWLTSIIAHYGLWKPAGVTGTEGSINNTWPGGIGKPSGTDDYEAMADITHGQDADPVLTAETAPSPYPEADDDVAVQDDGTPA